MKTDHTSYRTIWIKPDDPHTVQAIDQRWLPHRFVIEDLKTLDQAVCAIKEMHVRGAPLIGVTAAFGMYLAVLKDASDHYIREAGEKLKAARPTAVNLQWAVDQQLKAILDEKTKEKRSKIALQLAQIISDEDVERCKKIGEFGLGIIQKLQKQKKTESVVNILTHCNAGWLACVEWGTATAPIYLAFECGIQLHVWVSETRPRNQGANLTAWELEQRKIPHTVVVDNAAGHLMRLGKVDLVIVGADRVTSTGDVANKIGTYLKALAAKENRVPFYAAFPSSTIDWNLRDGSSEIPIEERNADEVKYVQGLCENEIKTVAVMPENSNALNYAFDVTPRKLITGLITERGICDADGRGLRRLFPEPF